MNKFRADAYNALCMLNSLDQGETCCVVLLDHHHIRVVLYEMQKFLEESTLKQAAKISYTRNILYCNSVKIKFITQEHVANSVQGFTIQSCWVSEPRNISNRSASQLLSRIV